MSKGMVDDKFQIQARPSYAVTESILRQKCLTPDGRNGPLDAPHHRGSDTFSKNARVNQSRYKMPLEAFGGMSRFRI